MAPLTPASAAALARLRAYVCPPSVYTTMPLSRRAAVLLLLFADRNGNLRVLLTLRASSMSSYSGQVALPGGKADFLSETAFETARREAEEEVGLPQTDLPPPFRVEHLCELPASLAVTEQAVRPCVAFLHTDSVKDANSDSQDLSGESLIPKLNATEVAAVFSAPFHRFISSKIEGNGAPSPISYDGKWQHWHGVRWRMHSFYIPRESMDATSVQQGENKDLENSIGWDGNSYKVWGLTARILIDSARIAYGEEPEFDYVEDIGEEGMIRGLLAQGRLKGERRKGSVMPRGKVEKQKKGDSADSAGRDNKL